MKDKFITIILSLSVFAVTASAQNDDFSPIRTEPVETTFTQDGELFSKLLSEFTTRCQQYDTLYESVWFNNPDKVPLNSHYEKILPKMPLFEFYPAFRIDCANGYILGIYSVLRIYNEQTSFISYVSYLDLLSFNPKGGLVSRLSLALNYINNYQLKDDSKKRYLCQIVSGVDIMNGEIHYGYDQRRFVNRDLISQFESTYVYKIQDDATLKLLSVERSQNQ